MHVLKNYGDSPQIQRSFKVAQQIADKNTAWFDNIYPKYDIPYKPIGEIALSFDVTNVQLKLLEEITAPLLVKMNLVSQKSYLKIMENIASIPDFSEMFNDLISNPSSDNYKIPFTDDITIEISSEQIEEKRDSLYINFNLWLDNNADYIIIILLDILLVYYFFGTKDIQNIAKTAIDFLIEAFVVPKINEPFYSKIPDFWNKTKANYFDKSKK